MPNVLQTTLWYGFGHETGYEIEKVSQIYWRTCGLLKFCQGEVKN
jgi:hypothetical protein